MRFFCLLLEQLTNPALYAMFAVAVLALRLSDSDLHLAFPFLAFALARYLR